MPPDITTHWARACILALTDRGLVRGFPDGSFRPDVPFTRAEFAALLLAAFPATAAVRSALSFSDVPQTHWAYGAVIWGYERGLFSGYPDGSFQPDLSISRIQAIVVLVTILHLPAPLNPNQTLRLYFDDAAAIPNWGQWAIAAAVLNNRIVNYPNVREFQPTQAVTRGELSALLCLALAIPNVVPLQFATWTIGIQEIQGAVTVPASRWQGCARLMYEIQEILTRLRLYSGAIEGRYNLQTEQALTQFCNFYSLNAMKEGLLNESFAKALIHADSVAFIGAHSKNPQQIYLLYLAQEAGFNANKLAFLDRGYPTSLYAADISRFPTRLTLKPDGINVTSSAALSWDWYPSRGEQPNIRTIDFLHSDILQACICVGSFVEGKIRARWFGKKPLQPAQLWSTTKILPLLNVVCRANAKNPRALIRDCLVRSADNKDSYSFYKLAVDLVSYQGEIGSSNAIAALFKQFSTSADLQSWIQSITGNYSSEFQGRYGEPPLIDRPDLWSPSLKTRLLSPADGKHSGNNAVSTYDLTRFISLVGWHNHLLAKAQMPSAQWSSLETVIRALATDTARYVDVAINQLGLAAAIESPVILSKMGFGRSDIRDRTELAYVAFVQFIDKRPRAQNKPAVLHSFSLALLAAIASGDADAEARQIDARMAAEVTEIIRRIMTGELA